MVFHILIAFGAFQALFIALVLLAPGKQRLAKRLFAVLLFIEGLTLIERLLADTELIRSVPHLLGISYPLSFIKPPLILFTAKAIIDSNFSFRRSQLFHFIPFFFFLLLNIPFYFLTAAEKLAFVQQFLQKIPAYNSFDFYLFLAFYAYIGIYLVLTVRLLGNYRKHIKNNFLVNWHLRVLQLYALVMLVNLIYFLILPSGLLEVPIFHKVSMLVMTFLIQSIAYSFFSSADIFAQGVQADLSKLDQRSKDEQRIKAQFEVHKVHLDDTISLDKFAASMQLPKKYVSDLINQGMGCTFKDLLNEYRIKEAIQLMQQYREPKKSLIEIAYSSGYTNKVSFYRSFKKIMGMAPSDYYQILSNPKSKPTPK